MSVDARPFSITACLVGLKGSVYLRRAIENGLPVSRVVSYEQQGDESQSFADIQAFALKSGLEFEVNKRPAFSPEDLVFVVGWQFLFHEVTRSTIVFHDSLLPRFRGFAPTVNALICGENQIGVTALMPTTEVDAGPIISQASFQVTYPVRIYDALTRQAILMADLSSEIFASWSSGKLTPTEQDDSKATYSIWRDASDFFIDWSKSSDEIVRFIDAVSFPYDCARTMLDNDVIRITAATVVRDLEFELRQPGKIWSFENDKPLVICGQGMIRIENFSRDDGKPYAVKKLRSRFS